MNARELLLDSPFTGLADVKTKLERRNGEERIACTLSAVRIDSVSGGHTDVKGFVLNVSKSGLGFCADKSFRPGTNVIVAMDNVSVRGSIRWCRRNPGDFFDMGLQIEDVIVTDTDTLNPTDSPSI